MHVTDIYRFKMEMEIQLNVIPNGQMGKAIQRSARFRTSSNSLHVIPASLKRNIS